MELEESQRLVAWSNMSGTYQLPSEAAHQAGLDMGLFFEFVPADDVHLFPADNYFRHFLPDGAALAKRRSKADGATRSEADGAEGAEATLISDSDSDCVVVAG